MRPPPACLPAPGSTPRPADSTAADLAEDLRAFLAGNSAAEHQDVRIVPKGLRSFDASDSDFFLELLPGPRDRHGLPDNIGFWKQRLEERDPDHRFRVGLMYGPSGCGKSSLVKAGLLPRLAENVRPVYIEATADETETRLLAGLRKACPELPAVAARGCGWWVGLDVSAGGAIRGRAGIPPLR
jgi:hypothetical protein